MPEFQPGRVFISYSRDSESHIRQVCVLADKLRTHGFDAHLDEYELSPSAGWQRWMLAELDSAEFVLIVCTKQYRLWFEGLESNEGPGKGVNREGLFIDLALYEAKGRNLRFVPVLLPGATPDDIPRVLKPYSYYFLPKDLERVFRHLLHQPSIDAAIPGQTSVRTCYLERMRVWAHSLPQYVSRWGRVCQDPWLGLLDELNDDSREVLKDIATQERRRGYIVPELERTIQQWLRENFPCQVRYRPNMPAQLRFDVPWLITGPPGAGKSALMREVARVALEEGLVPVVLAAPRLTQLEPRVEDLRLDEIIARHTIETLGLPPSHQSAAPPIAWHVVILDGIDEVLDVSRRVSIVEWYFRQLRLDGSLRCPALLACRDREARLLLAGLEQPSERLIVINLAPFAHDERHDLILKLAPDEVQEERLSDRVEKLEELARTRYDPAWLPINRLLQTPLLFDFLLHWLLEPANLARRPPQDAPLLLAATVDRMWERAKEQLKEAGLGIDEELVELGQAAIGALSLRKVVRPGATWEVSRAELEWFGRAMLARGTAVPNPKTDSLQFELDLMTAHDWTELPPQRVSADGGVVIWSQELKAWNKRRRLPGLEDPWIAGVDAARVDVLLALIAKTGILVTASEPEQFQYAHSLFLEHLAASRMAALWQHAFDQGHGKNGWEPHLVRNLTWGAGWFNFYSGELLVQAVQMLEGRAAALLCGAMVVAFLCRNKDSALRASDFCEWPSPFWLSDDKGRASTCPLLTAESLRALAGEMLLHLSRTGANEVLLDAEFWKEVSEATTSGNRALPDLSSLIVDCGRLMAEAFATTRMGQFSHGEANEYWSEHQKVLTGRLASGALERVPATALELFKFLALWRLACSRKNASETVLAVARLATQLLDEAIDTPEGNRVAARIWQFEHGGVHPKGSRLTDAFLRGPEPEANIGRAARVELYYFGVIPAEGRTTAYWDQMVAWCRWIPEVSRENNVHRLIELWQKAGAAMPRHGERTARIALACIRTLYEQTLEVQSVPCQVESPLILSKRMLARSAGDPRLAPLLWVEDSDERDRLCRVPLWYFGIDLRSIDAQGLWMDIENYHQRFEPFSLLHICVAAYHRASERDDQALANRIQGLGFDLFRKCYGGLGNSERYEKPPDLSSTILLDGHRILDQLFLKPRISWKRLYAMLPLDERPSPRVIRAMVSPPLIRLRWNQIAADVAVYRNSIGTICANMESNTVAQTSDANANSMRRGRSSIVRNGRGRKLWEKITFGLVMLLASAPFQIFHAQIIASLPIIIPVILLLAAGPIAAGFAKDLDIKRGLEIKDNSPTPIQGVSLVLSWHAAGTWMFLRALMGKRKDWLERDWRWLYFDPWITQEEERNQMLREYVVRRLEHLEPGRLAALWSELNELNNLAIRHKLKLTDELKRQAELIQIQMEHLTGHAGSGVHPLSFDEHRGLKIDAVISAPPPLVPRIEAATAARRWAIVASFSAVFMLYRDFKGLGTGQFVAIMVAGTTIEIILVRYLRGKDTAGSVALGGWIGLAGIGLFEMALDRMRPMVQLHQEVLGVIIAWQVHALVWTWLLAILVRRSAPAQPYRWKRMFIDWRRRFSLWVLAGATVPWLTFWIALALRSKQVR